MARWLIIIGAVLIVVGVVLQFAPWLLSWFGRLPGDIRVETGNTRVFIPVTSMIILSVLLSLLLNLLNR
jgi:hypothetical protein